VIEGFTESSWNYHKQNPFGENWAQGDVGVVEMDENEKDLKSFI